VHADPVASTDPSGTFSLSGALTALGVGGNLRASHSASFVQAGLNYGLVATSAAIGITWGYRALIDMGEGRGPFSLVAPDAMIMAFSSSLFVSLLPAAGLIANAGFGFTSGFELMAIRNDPNHLHLFSYWGGGAGSAGVSASLSFGAVWGVDKPSDYAGAFQGVSGSVSWGSTLSPSMLRLLNSGWPNAVFNIPRFARGFTGSLFYDPGLKGSYGLSIGGVMTGDSFVPYELGDSVGGFGLSVTSTRYAHVASFQVPVSIQALFSASTDWPKALYQAAAQLFGAP
jgi:hypothetical protein